MKNKKTGVTRRAFMYLSGLTALALGKNVAAHEGTNQLKTNSAANEWSEMLKEINDFPLFKALFNRRLGDSAGEWKYLTGLFSTNQLYLRAP